MKPTTYDPTPADRLWSEIRIAAARTLEDLDDADAWAELVEAAAAFLRQQSIPRSAVAHMLARVAERADGTPDQR